MVTFMTFEASVESMSGESLQRFAIVLIGTAVYFELVASAPVDYGFFAMLAALLLGLVGVLIDVFSGRFERSDDPRPYAD